LDINILNEINSNITSDTKFAIFDIDGTISRTTILTFYIYAKEKKISNKLLYKFWLMYFVITHIPLYFLIDSISREQFQKLFFLKLKEFSYEEITNYAEKCFKEKILNLFINETIDLINNFKSKGINVILLTVSIDPLVKHYGNFFNAPYECLRLKNNNGKVQVDFSNHRNLKYNYIKKFNPNEIITIADSKHDLPILEYSKYSIIIARKEKKWYKKIKSKSTLIIYK